MSLRVVGVFRALRFRALRSEPLPLGPTVWSRSFGIGLVVGAVLLVHCRSTDKTAEQTPTAGKQLPPTTASASAAAAPSRAPSAEAPAAPAPVSLGHSQPPTSPESATPNYEVKDGWAVGDGYQARIDELRRCNDEAQATPSNSGEAGSSDGNNASAGSGGTAPNRGTKVVLGVKVYVEGDKTLFVRSTDFSLRSGGIHVRAALNGEPLLRGCEKLGKVKPLEARLLNDKTGLGGWIAFEFPERLAKDLYLEYNPLRFLGRARVVFRVPECLDCPNDPSQKPRPTGQRLVQ